MPCDSLAVQRAKLEPKVFEELAESEAARATLLGLIQPLVPTRQLTVDAFNVGRTHSGRRVEGGWVVVRAMAYPSLSVQVDQNGNLRVSGDIRSEVDKVRQALEAKLPELALAFATMRLKAAAYKAARVRSEERVGPNAYRLRATIPLK